MDETRNSLSDEFFRKYGLFELSTEATFVFNPAVLYENDYGNSNVRVKKASYQYQDDHERNNFRVWKAPSPSLPPADVPREKLPVFLAIFVRLLLIGHNTMTVWRVTLAYKDDMYWLLLIANLLLIAEGVFTVSTRGGLDYNWWCPCFLVYLVSTLPLVWLLQLKQYDATVAGNTQDDTTVTTTTVAATKSTDTTPAISTVATLTDAFNTTTISMVMTTLTNITINAANISSVTGIQNVTEDLFTNVSSTTISDFIATETENTTTIEANTTILTTTKASLELPPADNELWLIIVQESLIYLLVFGRWLLPRRNESRDFLADLLLEFLAIASDIMELLAVFDEPTVRSHRLLTYWVMGVWSASFIQFVPVLAHKRMYRRLRNPQMKACTRACGEYFVELVYTCMSIFLQDGPFLVLRLYIMIRLRLITYSLVFFVLKNIVTLLLLFYRMGLMCFQLPCNKRQRTKLGDKKIPLNGETGSITLKENTEFLNEKF